MGIYYWVNHLAQKRSDKMISLLFFTCLYSHAQPNREGDVRMFEFVIEITVPTGRDILLKEGTILRPSLGDEVFQSIVLCETYEFPASMKPVSISRMVRGYCQNPGVKLPPANARWEIIPGETITSTSCVDFARLVDLRTHIRNMDPESYGNWSLIDDCKLSPQPIDECKPILLQSLSKYIDTDTGSIPKVDGSSCVITQKEKAGLPYMSLICDPSKVRRNPYR